MFLIFEVKLDTDPIKLFRFSGVLAVVIRFFFVSFVLRLFFSAKFILVLNSSKIFRKILYEFIYTFMINAPAF
jgi:hypothetical protein